MKEYTTDQKKELRDKIIAMQEASGLSGNEFATKRLGFTNGSKFSHVRNNWDKPGMVGAETWEAIAKLIESATRYKGVPTENLKKVWNTCQRAYDLKKPMAVIGEGGLGKTFALDKFKEHIEKQRAFKVIYFDASMTRTNKQFVSSLMKAMDCYRPGTISDQIVQMKEYVTRQNMLLCIDEASSMEGHNITIIKDIMTAFKDLCGVVFAGTPYFINNLNRGALRNRHLFSETRDRLFMLPEKLEEPTPEEAEAIFRANGITDTATLDIVMGRNKKMLKYSYTTKRTYRGIRDCIDLIRIATSAKEFDFNKIEL
jgi:hypothetical protein